VVPPVWATIAFFPDWMEKGYKTTFSGVAMLLLAISVLPLLRYVWQKLKSPSAWVIWTILYASLFALNKIIDEALIISQVGALSNAIGCALFYAARIQLRKNK
jgi:cobalamin biosynthesis protein CobD/CbiB